MGCTLCSVVKICFSSRSLLALVSRNSHEETELGLLFSASQARRCLHVHAYVCTDKCSSVHLRMNTFTGVVIVNIVT